MLPELPEVLLWREKTSCEAGTCGLSFCLWGVRRQRIWQKLVHDIVERALVSFFRLVFQRIGPHAADFFVEVRDDIVDGGGRLIVVSHGSFMRVGWD